MRPPLPTGTILQDRYRILSVLGQGGFGRTYLTEDQGRFNELCAMKELSPSDNGGYALEKAKELFLREGQTLYQIQHPQIPQFRATFEFEQRLFLVQDYVEGLTYRHLLDQRRAQGYAFTEAEVKQLLMQLLPVLAHIHSKGIIHRDITPDNIILRDRDRLPVLIDFGVVKELATRFQSPGTVFTTGMDPNTTVGKVGYAPPEQMQTGRAYPSSDLYSLAVTAVVLLTGREPQELFDDATLTWYWQRWVSVDPGFAQVINRMLSYRPGDRFQSADDVMRALQSPVPMPQAQAPLGYPQTSYQPPPQSPTASRVPTMAIDRRVDYDAADYPRAVPVIEEPRSSVWDDPLAVVAIGLGLVILTGIASWAIVRAVLTPNQPAPIASVTPTETVTPSPLPTASRSPTPKPTASQPATSAQRLDIAAGTKVVQNGTLGANETVNYVVSGQQGEQFSALLGGEGVLMSILGSNRQPLGDEAQRVSFWQGTLPYSGDYYIQLKPINGLRRSDYRLEVSLNQPSEPSPTPIPRPPYPAPNPEPSIATERVQFAPGDTGTVITDRTTPSVVKRYLLSASQGQIMSVRVARGAVTLNIRYPGGRIVQDASNVLSWESELPQSGDYMIDVVAFQNTRFELDVSIRDLVRGDNNGGLPRSYVDRSRSNYPSGDGRDFSYRSRYRQPRNFNQDSSQPRNDRDDSNWHRYRQPRNSDQNSSQSGNDRDSSSRRRYRQPRNPDQDSSQSGDDRSSSDHHRRRHHRDSNQDSPQPGDNRDTSDRVPSANGKEGRGDV